MSKREYRRYMIALLTSEGYKLDKIKRITRDYETLRDMKERLIYPYDTEYPSFF